MDGILSGYGSEEEVTPQVDHNTTDPTPNEGHIINDPISEPEDDIDNINGDVFGIKESLSNKPKQELYINASLNPVDKQIITTVPHVVPAIVSKGFSSGISRN